MKYQILLLKPARKFIQAQPRDQQKRIIAAIELLPEGDIKRLQGKSDVIYRLRVGDYRIIFTRDDDRLLIQVVNAGNRGQIYK